MTFHAILLSDVVDGPLWPLVCRLLRDLIDQQSCSMERLIDQLWGQDRRGGPLSARRIIHLYIHKIRQVLKPGWQIINERGWGYRLVWQETIKYRRVA